MGYQIDDHDLEYIKSQEKLSKSDEAEIDLEKFFESKQMEDKAISINLLTEINESIKTLKKMFVYLLLKKEESKIKQTVNEVKTPPVVNNKEAIERLLNFAKTRTVDNKKEFLLHRGTEDYEYEKSFEHPNMFNVLEDSLFFADADGGEEFKKQKNPVVSIWVPEDKIEVQNPKPNTGILGDHGKNPHAESYQVKVKPGKYQIYSEISE